MTEVSAFLLERYHIDEVTVEERAAVDRALAADEALAGRLAALRQSDAAIRERYLCAEGKLTASLRQREQWRRLLRRAVPVAAAVCIVFSALWGLWDRRPPTEDRAKGGAEKAAVAAGDSLAVYLKTDTRLPKAVSDGNGRVTLHEGDTIQLAYTAGGNGNGNRTAAYGVIFSIDGRAALTLHHPSTADGTTRLVMGKQTALSEAYTLDDAPRFETFFLVMSAAPLDVDAVLARGQSLAAEVAPESLPEELVQACAKTFAGYAVQSLIVYKE